MLEALEITMSSNNGKFANNFFIQINGATIGGPESASVTNIFGAVYIDTIAKSGAYSSNRLEEITGMAHLILRKIQKTKH